MFGGSLRDVVTLTGRVFLRPRSERRLFLSLHDGVTCIGSCCVFLRTRSERRLVPSTYPSLLRDGVTLRVECGFSSHSIGPKSSLDSWLVFLQDGVTLFGAGYHDLISSEGFPRVGLMGACFPDRPWDELRHPLVDRAALKSGSVPHSVVFASGEDSVCTPLANEAVGLDPSSSSGPVASRPPLGIGLLRWPCGDSFHLGVFMRWSSTHGGLLAALPEVGLLGRGYWRIVRVPQILCLTPLPGVRSRLLVLASRYGRCSRRRHFHVTWNPPLSRARGCPSLPLRVATLSLMLSRSEVPGPPVLLSYYIACIISRCPGALSSFVTLPGLSLWFFRTGLGLHGAPSNIRRACFLVRKALFILASASAELVGVFHAMSFRGSHSRGWGEVSFSFVPGFVAKIQGPPPLLLGLRASLYQPTLTRDIRNERLISCVGGQVFPGPLGLRIVGDANGSFLPQGVA